MACSEANKELYRQLKEERIHQDIKPEPIPPKPTRPPPSTSTREDPPPRDVPRPRTPVGAARARSVPGSLSEWPDGHFRGRNSESGVGTRW